MKDITNQKFGTWTALYPSDKRDSNQMVYWWCECKCGVVREVSGRNLRKGSSTNCGCNRPDQLRRNHTTHGLSKTRFYKVWAGMLKRCLNPNASRYKFYGAKGVKVIQRWISFDNFLADMYESYKAHCEKFGEQNTTIERLNPNKDYEPENCIWATWEQQFKNKRNSYG